jgi:hypothetical protein
LFKNNLTVFEKLLIFGRQLGILQLTFLDSLAQVYLIKRLISRYAAFMV